MKKLVILISFAVGFVLKAQIPNFVWAKQLGGISADRGNDIECDANNNVFSVGFFNGVSDFDPGVGTFTLNTIGSNEGYVSKLDANGNFVWAKSLSCQSGASSLIQAISVDASGNFYITGRFIGVVDFDMGVTTYTVNSSTFAIFVCKYDNSGNFIWAKAFNGSSVSSGTSGFDIETDISGNVFTTGYFNGSIDFDPGPSVYTMTCQTGASTNIFISKLDPSGNFIWAKQIGGATADGGRGLSVDLSGNVYTTGEFYGNVDFDPGAGIFTLNSGTVTSCFICKLDNFGNFSWAKGLIGNNTCYGRKILVDQASSVYCTGDFYGLIDFDPSPTINNLSSLGVRDIFVQKMDMLGNFVWVKQFGGPSDENVFGLAKDASGNISFSGQFVGPLDFDPGPSTYTLVSSGTFSATDAFVCSINSAGNFLMAAQIGGVNLDRSQGVTISSSGHILTTGYFTGNADFDPLPSSYTITSFGSSSDDSFVLKLTACLSAPSQTSMITGFNSVCVGSGSQSYSIATAVGATSYSWSLPAGWSGSSNTNTIAATVGSSGNFSVTAINACGSSSASVLSVTVNPSPTVSVNSGSMCVGQSFTITPSGANTYTFQGGNSVVSPTATTSYTVTGTSTAGCVGNVATSNIAVNALPTINVSTSNTLICVGQPATLNASGANTYTFNPGGAGASIVISPTVTTNYTVTGTNVGGCQNSSVITQSVSACTNINNLTYNLQQTTFEIYPNPANGLLNIKLETFINSGQGILDNNKNVIITNSLGQIVLDEKLIAQQSTYNIQHFPYGIYFVKIGNSTKKIIKQ